MADLLSIIIVNYRSGQLINDCLQSVYQFNPLNLEIIVVNNEPTDDSRDFIKHRYPQVHWIEMGYNAGFARANNAGMKAATGNVFLLLNPDTLAIDGSITRCFHRLLSLNLAAAGVQLLDQNKTQQISGSFFVKGGLNHLLPIPYWGDFVRWIGYRAKAKVPGLQEAGEVEPVDWISGAFLMVKKSAVAKAGMMDEDFFLYGEEVEWCSRLKAAGKLALFGDLRIIHLEGATINKSQHLDEKGYYNLYDKKGLQLMVSNHVRVRKQYGAGWFMVLLINYSFGLLVFWIAGTLHRLLMLKNPFSHWGKVGAFGRNLIAVWKLAPIIVKNEPHFYKLF